MEGARRALISMKDMQREGATFSKSNAFQGTPEEFVGFLMAAAERRFGGMSEAKAEEGSGVFSTLFGIIEQLREAVARPWWDRFKARVIALNKWLLDLADSPAWAAIVKWSGKVADAIDKMLGSAIKWLTGREWKWDNFKDGFMEALGAIRTSAENLFNLGVNWVEQIKNLALNAVDELAVALGDQIQTQLREMSRLMVETGNAMKQAAVRHTEETGGLWRTDKGRPTLMGAPISWAGMKIFGKRLGPGDLARSLMGDAFMKAGQVPGQGAHAMRKAAEGAPERIEARDARLAQLRAEGAVMGAAFAEEAKKGLADVVAAALPPKPAAPPAAAAADARAAAFKEHPALGRMEANIDLQQKVAGHLANAGEVGKAARAAEDVAYMRSLLDTLLREGLADGKLTADEVSKMVSLMQGLLAEQAQTRRVTEQNSRRLDRLAVGYAR